MLGRLRNLKSKYKSIPVAAKASLWYTICSIIQKGVVLLATPLFTRLMTTEEYGLYTIYQSWYSIIIIFATLNMFYSAYNNVLTKYEDEKDIATSSMLGLSTTITCAITLVYFIDSGFWNSLFKLPLIVMVIMLFQILFEPALNFWMVRQRYDYKYKNVVLITIILSFVGTGLSAIAVILCKDKGVARIIVFALVQALFGLVFYLLLFLRGKTFYSRKFWKFTLSFCLPLIPHYLSFTILNQADRIMINNIIGQGEAAIYAVAYTIALMLQIVTQAITNSLTPYTYQSIKKKDFSGIRNTTSAILVGVSILCIMVMLLSPEVLRIFASSEYASAIYVMPPVVASTFFLFLYPMFSTVEFYFEKTKFIMIASSTAAALNIVLNYIFIPIYGYYAAGFTTLFCYIAISIGHFHFYKRIISNNDGMMPLYDIKVIIVTSIIVLLFSIVCMFIYDFFLIRYIIIALLCLVCLLLKSRILELLKRLKSR